MSHPPEGSTPPKRPVFVWIICLLFFIGIPFSLVAMAVKLALITSGKVPLPEAHRHFIESLGLFNYYLPQLLNSGLVLAWAVQLFRLKRDSIYFFVASIGVGTLMFIANFFKSAGWHVFGIILLVGAIVFWSLKLLLLYYNWYLIKTNVLR